MVNALHGWSSQKPSPALPPPPILGTHFEEFASRRTPRVLGFPKVALPEPVTLSCSDSRAWLNVVAHREFEK